MKARAESELIETGSFVILIFCVISLGGLSCSFDQSHGLIQLYCDLNDVLAGRIEIRKG